jgi:hypothetical protein
MAAIDPRHVIHLQNGHFTPHTQTRATDLDALLDTFDAARSPSGLAIHLHGGLVSYSAALGIVKDLQPKYTDADAYPVFVVWESGPFETLMNNLQDIGKTDLFREMLRKLAEWALKSLGDAVGLRGGGPAPVDPQAVADALDAWHADPSAGVPFVELELRLAGADARAASLNPDAMLTELEADLETDFRLTDAVRNIPSGEAARLRAAGVDLFDDGGPGGRGFVSTAKAAVFLAKLTVAVGKRLLNGRGHGLFGTVMEELYRAFGLARAGKEWLWEQMKLDTEQACRDDQKPGNEAGLTALLTRMGARYPDPAQAPRVTLIGHSTGGVYICHILDAAARHAPALTFDLVLLAPACTTSLFRRAYDAHRQRIRGVRVFGMKDAVERADAMAEPVIGPAGRALYPHSLLYCVSGILEPEVDTPLLGMQRFLIEEETFDAAHFPDVAWARKEIGSTGAVAAVWSEQVGVPGYESRSKRHGDFDDETVTINSVAHILKHGIAPRP